MILTLIVQPENSHLKHFLMRHPPLNLPITKSGAFLHPGFQVPLSWIMSGDTNAKRPRSQKHLDKSKSRSSMHRRIIFYWTQISFIWVFCTTTCWPSACLQMNPLHFVHHHSTSGTKTVWVSLREPEPQSWSSVEVSVWLSANLEFGHSYK